MRAAEPKPRRLPSRVGYRQFRRRKDYAAAVGRRDQTRKPEKTTKKLVDWFTVDSKNRDDGEARQHMRRDRVG